jgi:hypothetical protein
MRVLECPRCKQRMEEGYLLDLTHNGIPRQAQWVEGRPQYVLKWFLSAPRRGRRKVTGYRCTSCGYLELYAASVDERI